MPLTGVIFDGDGTLYDSMGILFDSYQELVESTGNDYVFESVYYDNAAHFWASGVRSVMKYYQLDVYEDEFIARAYEITYRHYLERVELFDGVTEFVRALHEAGVKLVCASGMRSPIVSDVLKKYGIRDCFVDVLSCEDYGYGKYKPNVYYGALEVLEAPVTEVVSMEDEPFAIKTAGDIGLATVSVYHEKDGYDRAEVERNAMLVVEEYSELSVERLRNLVSN